MQVKILVASIGLLCVFSKGAHSIRNVHESNIRKENLAPITKTVAVAVADEVYQALPTESDKLPMEVIESYGNVLEEGIEEEKLSESMVDEETIKNAEKEADKDLLNGLNRILKNNETLKDVLMTENVYEIP